MAGAADGSTVFMFGKHKGRSFQEVAQSEPSYCAWALKMESPSGALQDFVTFLGGARKEPREVKDGLQLPADAFFLCEMVADDQFVVRCEKQGGKEGTAFLPPHLWHAIGALPGAVQMNRSWAFPASSYEPVMARLEEMGKAEGVPWWVRKLLKAPREAQGLQEARLPDGLMPYQLEGVEFGLSRNGRVLLADDMGLGKTLQALALARQFPEWPVLVVCPSSLRWVWKEQAISWFSETLRPEEVQVIQKGSDQLCPKAQMWIISYNLLASDAKKGRFQRRPNGQPHGLVIADESHNIKDWSAARTKVLVPLLRQASRAVLLSGTPIRNAPDELHPQLCALMPELNLRIAEFRSRYCLQQLQNFGGRQVNRVVGSRCAAELNFLLTSTVMIRRLKQDVLSQLPSKRRQRIPLQVGDSKMKEISSSREAEGMGEGAPNLFQKIAQAKLPAVKEYISEVLDRVNEKIIIFAHHQNMMDEIAAVLSKQLSKGHSFVRIDGHTAQAKRPEMVQKFQEDCNCRIALLSITACGEGITLTAASLVIFAELYWVPGAVEQAEARAHRLGSSHSKVVVEFLVVPDSADERIYKRLEQKKQDTSHVLDGAPESMNVTLSQQTPRKRQVSPVIFPTVETKKKPRCDTPSPVDRVKAREVEDDRAKVQALLKAIQAGRKALGAG
ncbi:unnamed protein product [Effrenium voratum]|uniref:Uncharacterized protein n=1 Tax=Effrenium voratum TaxID=2562239 RepID=A0AA36JDI4_9DINO|nr:unnamed protein product [Effrenium voratum]